MILPTHVKSVAMMQSQKSQIKQNRMKPIGHGTQNDLIQANSSNKNPLQKSNNNAIHK